jgi:hypothetical protein
MTKDCTLQHYYRNCNVEMPSLKQPRPSAALCALRSTATIFFQLPESLFKHNVATTTTPTASIYVSGEVSIMPELVQKEVAQVDPVATPWKWETMTSIRCFIRSQRL